MITKTGFSNAGLLGQEYLLMQKYLDVGYEVLYEEAPYNWCLINVKTQETYTYSEGDFTLNKAESKEEFILELNKILSFCEKNEIYTNPLKIEVEK